MKSTRSSLPSTAFRARAEIYVGKAQGSFAEAEAKLKVESTVLENLHA